MSNNMHKNWVFLDMAGVMAQLSTCKRRSVGCLLLDSNYRIVGSGYNGAPSGAPHCKDIPCPFVNEPHGSTCNSIHAEANAIRQCQNVDSIHTVCTTSFPCFECFKLIANTGAYQIIYRDDYKASYDLVHQLNNTLKHPIRFIKIGS